MIRKTAFLVTGTVTGVVAVLSYNPPELSNAISSTGSALATENPVTVDATTNPSTDNSQTPTASPKATPKSTRTPKPAATEANPSPTQSKSSGVSGTFTGDTSQTRWGPVQVQVTLTDGKITDVSTLQYPNGDRRSQMISSQVIPWLQQETLQIQSANISGISGATYTSVGFQASLASALQKAGL